MRDLMWRIFTPLHTSASACGPLRRARRSPACVRVSRTVRTAAPAPLAGIALPRRSSDPLTRPRGTQAGAQAARRASTPALFVPKSSYGRAHTARASRATTA